MLARSYFIAVTNDIPAHQFDKAIFYIHKIDEDYKYFPTKKSEHLSAEWFPISEVPSQFPRWRLHSRVH